MKNKIVELDVDFIGSQNETLTKEEKKMISDFIRLCKEKNISKGGYQFVSALHLKRTLHQIKKMPQNTLLKVC